MALSKFSSSDCEFVAQTSKDFDCPVCFQLLRNPFLTACCGNHFCDTCVKSMKEKSRNRCPFCNEKPISGITDKKFQRQINELQVYCVHKKHGCLWVGGLGKLATHLESDKSDGECKYVMLPCSLTCGKQMLRCELKQHLTEECPLRTYMCEYCGFSSTYKDVTTTHYSDCPNYPIICPNSCTEETLKRSSLDHHLLTCPDEVVSCAFNEMGCEERIKRRCLQQHIEANAMHHQLMICNAFKSVKKENEVLKDDIKLLKQKNEELQKSNASLKNAQCRMVYSINGFVLKMDEGVKGTPHWKEYFLSLAMVSTNAPNPVCPVIIKWPDYSEIKQVVKNSNMLGRKSYYTRPFYTHCNGYKMQLSVNPEDECISIYCYLMRGENDDHLTWPYKGIITITLLNQLNDSEHFTRVLQLGNSMEAEHADVVMQPESDKVRNTGWGYAKFILLSEIESFTAHKQYLMNDTLYFKISATTLI